MSQIEKGQVINKRVSSSHFNILMIWNHAGLRLTNGPLPGGRRASSSDFRAMTRRTDQGS
jgi:hypothetical protein